MTTPTSILVIFGTRPEAIKLFPVVNALKADPRFACTVCVSAQHRQMLDQVLEIAGIVPDHDLDVMEKPDQSLDELTRAAAGRPWQSDGRSEARPGDRAGRYGHRDVRRAGRYYRKIPVDHVEAGLRSGNIYHPWPEEINRKIIGSMASLHFAPSHRRRRADGGERRPGAYPRHRQHRDRRAALGDGADSRQSALAAGLDDLKHRFAGKRLIGVTSHRRENFGDGMENIASAIGQIAARDDVAVIFPVHLNPNVRRVMGDALGDLPNVAMIEPLDYPHFAPPYQPVRRDADR